MNMHETWHGYWRASETRSGMYIFNICDIARCLKTSEYWLVYSTTRQKAVLYSSTTSIRELNHLWEVILTENNFQTRE